MDLANRWAAFRWASRYGRCVVGGFGDKLRTLQIMKDPSCGPIGVLSLVIICLLKFALVYVLIEQHQTLFLVFVPVFGRIVPSILF